MLVIYDKATGDIRQTAQAGTADNQSRLRKIYEAQGEGVIETDQPFDIAASKIENGKIVPKA